MNPLLHNRQQGFLLISTVIVLAILAAMVLMLSSSTSLDYTIVSQHQETADLDYVVESGVAHANWRLAQNTSCANYTDIPVTSFGNHSYSANFAPATGSPLNVSVTGTLANGSTRNVTLSGVRKYLANTTTVLQPGAEGTDTYIRDGANDSNNFGASDILKINNASAEEASLLKFDLSGIPGGVHIESATLELWLEGGQSLSNGILDLNRVTQAWVEGDKDGQAPPAGAGATYMSYNGQTNWANEGGDYASPPVDTVSITSLSPGWHQWNIAPVVQDWVAGTASNNGVLLRASGGNVQKIFFSSGDGIAAQRPRLTISYGCECGQPCSTGAPTGSLLMVVNNLASLTTEEAARKALIESWGYSVSLIDDSDSQSNLDTAAAANDVIYVSEEIDNTELQDKLRNTATGVVVEEQYLFQDFGFSASRSQKPRTQINVVDNSHYITSEFPIGLLDIYTSDQLSSMIINLGIGTQNLAELNNTGPSWQPGVAVIETGDEMVGGGSAPARRAKLPFQSISALNDNGKTLMRRAIEWAADAGNSLPLLLVVADAGSPSNEEILRKDLLESWGYAVNLIDDSDSQANYDAAALVNDVVYVVEEIVSTEIGGKLINVPIGVVNEEQQLRDELGFASHHGKDYFVTDIDIVDVAHEITSGFATGDLSITSSNQPMQYLQDTLSVDLKILAYYPSLIQPSLAVLDVGDATYDGGSAAGRRVWLPWGGNAFQFSALNADGQTIMRRAIEWAAGNGSDLGLIAHWKLDETSGTTAVDSIGGNDGTLINGPSWVTGILDGGLSFDGSNDYIDVSSMNPRGYDDFTISAWYKSEDSSSSDDEYIFMHFEGFITDGVTFGPTDDSGYDDRLRLTIDVNNVADRHYGTSDMVDQQWHHVVAVRSGGRIKLYVDNLLESDQVDAHAGTTVVVDGAGPFIGDYPGGTEQVHGILDDVRLYDRGLSDAEIAALFAASGGGGGGGGGGGCDGTFRDEFNSQNYSGSNGTLSWAGDWQETGETTNPTAGDIRVGDDGTGGRAVYQLQVRDDGQTVWREADLSTAGSAALNFLFRRENLNGSSDYVAVEVSYDGGSNWSELARFTGTATDSSYASASYPLDAGSLSANTRIRFITPTGGMSNSNMVWFDDVQITCAP